ncbi:hypothetical protein Acsp06_23940 [Actinomycetospora sp. NBRC 106375]|nr:hypothetical protein Acsp06_23940 [Actinomycetospora sp. NBRC 106375]
MSPLSVVRVVAVGPRRSVGPVAQTVTRTVGRHRTPRRDYAAIRTPGPMVAGRYTSRAGDLPLTWADRAEAAPGTRTATFG